MSEKPVIDPSFLLRAYASGVFPMAMEDGEIGWFSPDPRGVIPLSGVRVSKSLSRVLKKGSFDIRLNTAFREVMLGCADRDSTWIDECILETYCLLHGMGHAHSVETWRDGELLGGLYGVSIGGAFFGESMFSRATDASKVALVHLVQRLDQQGFVLLDTQWTTPHLKRLGAFDLPRDDYLSRLEKAVGLDVTFN